MIGDRWGVSAADVAKSYPCDDFVSRAAVQAWRGVSVAAPSAIVWPWVAQIRLAPYSYDWIDNVGRQSPQQLRALPDPVPGEPFTTAAGRRIGRVLSAAPGREFTGTIAGVFISYVLEPDDQGTRLLMKLVAARGRWFAPLFSVGDLVMARRQLLNIKALAEQAGERQSIR